MDHKMIEMNNLRVLNDYLNQTIDVLTRQPRLGQTGPAGFGFSPFGTTPFAPMPTTGIGTDTVFGSWFGTPGFPQAGSWFGTPGLPQTPFGTPTPFTGQPMFGAIDPFFAQRSFTPMGYSPFGPASFAPTGFGPALQPWSAMSEVTRQAQLNQALVARQSVLEAMCRACGIPV
jgi:hypothetical protein